MLTEQRLSRREEFNHIKATLEKLDQEASRYLDGRDLEIFSMTLKNIMDRYPYFEHYIRQEEQGFGEQTEMMYREKVVDYVNPYLLSLDCMIELAKEKQ